MPSAASSTDFPSAPTTSPSFPSGGTGGRPRWAPDSADRDHSGICGQAPSDYPDFAAFLVREGIDSISLNPDSVLKITVRVLEMEKGLGKARLSVMVAGGVNTARAGVAPCSGCG